MTHPEMTAPLAEPRLPDQPSPQEKSFALTTVTAVIEKALKGELARDRKPFPNEPQILGPQHINMILDRAAGYQLKEIAERWDYSELQVANVLGSPDAQTILSTLFSMQAGALVSMEARFKALAPLALNVKTEMLQDREVSPGVRDRIATDILDRAGYAPRKEVESRHTHVVQISATQATDFRAALAESQRVAEVDYQKFLRASDAEVVQSHLQLTEAAGPEVVVDGAPPVPASDAQEKVA